MLLALPVAALVFARLAENQFVRETERSLTAQAVIFAEVFSAELSEVTPGNIGLSIPETALARASERYHPIDPTLDADQSLIHENAGDGRLIPHPPLPAYDAISTRLSRMARGAQKTTLAAYRFTDTAGRVIGSSGAGMDRSLAHLPEVQAALSGEVASVLRFRDPPEERHALSSISRDTGFRVHVAHPVILSDRIVGAVQVSRTPLNLQKFLYSERVLLAQLGFALLLGASVLGFVFWRFISRPILALRAQSREVAGGTRPAPEPLEHYGVAELADLGDSVLSMANALTERADELRIYTDHVTHELKSPVTSIIGAAELLNTSGEDMAPDRRQRLIDAIHGQGLRMDALLAKLRELARARLFEKGSDTDLAEAVDALREAHPSLAVTTKLHKGFRVPLSPEALGIVLTQIFKNAAEHGATKIELSSPYDVHSFTIHDNGAGIGPANRPKIFEPFFTTRRANGGTGMGLNIVATVIERHGGEVALEDTEAGTTFLFTFDP